MCQRACIGLWWWAYLGGHGDPLTRASSTRASLALVAPQPHRLVLCRAQVCRSAFKASNRRHHCRHCGRIVCADCSPHKLAIPKFGIRKPERVCNDCEPVLALYGDRPLGPPSVTRDDAAERILRTDVANHLDAQLSKTTESPPEPSPPATPPARDPAPLFDTTPADHSRSHPASLFDTTPAAAMPGPAAPLGVPTPEATAAVANPFGEVSAVAMPPNPFGCADSAAAATAALPASNPFGETADASVSPAASPAKNPFGPGREQPAGNPFGDA